MNGMWISLCVAWCLSGAESGRPPVLDMPDNSGLIADAGDEASDTTEMFGETLAGDAFFFCLDRSGSMAVAADERGTSALEKAKREIDRALVGLGADSAASIVLCDRSPHPIVYGNPPIATDGAGKARLRAFVSGTVAGGRGFGLQDGVLRALEVAGRTSERHRALVLVTDASTRPGGDKLMPAAPEEAHAVLMAILAKNTQRIPIHIFCIWPRFRGDNVDVEPLRRIAAATGGKFKLVR